MKAPRERRTRERGRALARRESEVLRDLFDRIGGEDMSAKERRSLGRGLSALIPPKPPVAVEELPTLPPTLGLVELPIEEVLPSDGQPRQVFDDSRIDELAGSIRDHGVLQPIVVRQRAAQQYEIIAGERRWRASQRAGLRSIPCVITDIAEQDTLTVALVENLQREDLNPIEEAEAYERLHRELGYSQAEIAKAVGKERATVANSLRLLKLPDAVRQLVLDRELSMGHARALLALEDEREIERTSREALSKGWSVRDTERAVALRKAPRQPKGKKVRPRQSPAERELRERLIRALGTKVELVQKNGRGQLVVHFSGFDHLEDILEKMNLQ
jgi:ParB family chromosome partitioning protein